MAKTWGEVDLQIVVDSIDDESPSALSEKPILPNPEALDAIATILRQGGRKRKRLSARLYVATIEEKLDFEAQKDSGWTDSLEIDLTGTSGVYMIESVGKAEFKRWDQIFFDVTWVEA